MCELGNCINRTTHDLHYVKGDCKQNLKILIPDDSIYKYRGIRVRLRLFLILFYYLILIYIMH